MKLIFSFSTHISDYGGGRYTVNDRTDHVLKLYKISMERAKKFGHEIKFYGCNYSIDFLKGSYDSFVNVENIQLDITDDLKVYIHTKEKAGAVTIDGDIILDSKLKINKSSDIVFDREEKIKYDSRWQQIPIVLDALKKYNVEKYIDYFSLNEDYFYNVGILYFKNKTIKNIFIENWYKFKKWYMTEIEPKEKLIPKGIIVSTAITQYYFKNICDKLNIKPDFASYNQENNYEHYLGHAKFDDKIFDIINPDKSFI